MYQSDILFVHIPKAAGGSVKIWARDNQYSFVTQGHDTIPEIKATGKTWTTSFAITRNTYQRMVSLYLWSDFKARKFLRNGKKNIEISTQIVNNHAKGIDYFIEWYANNVEDFHNQMEYVEGVDIILEYENLEEDFKQIQKLTGISDPLPRTKSAKFVDTHAAHQEKLNSFITDSYIKTIDRLFPEEIEYFGYTPHLV